MLILIADEIKKDKGRGQGGELHNWFDGINGNKKQVQWFTTLSINKLFIISNQNLTWSILRPFHFRPFVYISMFFFKEEPEIPNVSKQLLSSFSDMCQTQILPNFFFIKSQLSDDFLYLYRGQKGRNTFCKIYNSYAT